jgi:uncharacterized protein YbjT (DUF2867 family)
VRRFEESGKQELLGVILGEEDSVAILDAGDVGAIAGTSLALRDVEEHNGKRYVVRGPENVSGKDVLEWVEEAAGTKIEEVMWRDTSMIKGLGEKGYPEMSLRVLYARVSRRGRGCVGRMWCRQVKRW